MRKLSLIPVILLCMTLCACMPVKTMINTPPATITGDSAIEPSPEETPAPIETTVNGEAEDPYADMEAQYLQDSKDIANECRVTIDGWEYYLDTENPVTVKEDTEFPLYRANDTEYEYEYLGTTGFEFLVAGKYIYVKQSIIFGDYGHWLTRRVDLDGGTTKLVGGSWDIYVSEKTKRLYITEEWGNEIYIADYSSEHMKTIKVKLPDWKLLMKRYCDATKTSEKDLYEDYFGTFLGVTDVKDGWIYFTCSVEGLPYDTIFSGKYRIRENGNGIEKMDTGEWLFDETTDEQGE